MRATLLAMAALLLVRTAAADDLERVKQLHLAGQYLEAAELGGRLDDAESLAWASASLAVYAYYEAPAAERENLARRALAIASRAKDRAEESGTEDDRLLALVHFQQGQALGRLVETLPRDEREAYADPVREAFERTLEHDAGFWQAHIGLARWHAQVMTFADDQGGGLGSLFANVFLDASYAEAEEHRAAAQTIDKSTDFQKIFWTESAEIRLLIDAEENREAARQDLERSLALPASEHLAQVIHGRAAACLEDVAACGARLRARTLE